MGDMRIRPDGRQDENGVSNGKTKDENGEVLLNNKFLYSCKPTDLLAIRAWAHTQEELFSLDPNTNKRVDILIKEIDAILNKIIFRGN